MNDQVLEQVQNVAVISDVKHYAVDIDKDGNEVRREIAPIEFDKALIDAAESN